MHEAADTGSGASHSRSFLKSLLHCETDGPALAPRGTAHYHSATESHTVHTTLAVKR